jgi:hypothetical protein
MNLCAYDREWSFNFCYEMKLSIGEYFSPRMCERLFPRL